MLAAAWCSASLRTDMTDRLTILLIGMLGVMLMLQPFLLSGSVNAITSSACSHRTSGIGWTGGMRPLLGDLARRNMGLAAFSSLFLLDLLFSWVYFAAIGEVKE